jgi:alcohol dehydrogenase class IV
LAARRDSSTLALHGGAGRPGSPARSPLPLQVSVDIDAPEAVYSLVSHLSPLMGSGRVLVAYDSRASELAEEVAEALRRLGAGVSVYRFDEQCRGLGFRLEAVDGLAEALRPEPPGFIVSMGSPCVVSAVKLAKIRLHRPTLKPEGISFHTILGVRFYPPLHVAVPTGLWSGREADSVALATTGGRALAAMNPELAPEAVVVDPALLARASRSEAVDCLLDLVSHTFESATTSVSSIISGDFSLLGLTHLTRAVGLASQTHSPAFWREAALASLYTGMAVASSGVSLTCALAIATQEEFPSLSHGATSAAYLPHIIRLYEAKLPDLHLRLARHLEILGGGGRPSEAAAAILRSLGAPSGLEALGVEASELRGRVSRIARRALELGGHLSPVSVSAAELERIILEAAAS